MANVNKKLYPRFRQLILYGIIGSFCAALDFAIYSLLYHFDIMPYLWANVVSIHIGIFTSFLLNRHLNFKVKDKTIQRLLLFYAVGMAGLGISTLMLYILVDFIGWNKVICKLITIIVVALVQFLLNKYVTFKHTKQ